MALPEIVYGSFTTTNGPAAVNVALGFLPDEFQCWIADDTGSDIAMLLYLASAGSGKGWGQYIITDSGTTGLHSMDYASANFITTYNQSFTESINIWQPSTAYAVGAVVQQRAPQTGTFGASPTLLFQCTTAGTSGSVEPVWPTAAGSVSPSDNGVYWTAIAYGGSGTSFTPSLAVSALQGVTIPAAILKASVTYHYRAIKQNV